MRPLPAATPLNQPFWDGGAQGILRVMKCRRCDHLWFPPAGRCPACRSDDIGWQDVSGRGVVWTWIRMHRSYIPAFADRIPYTVMFVRLDEGPMMMANLGDESAQIDCGTRVRVAFEDTDTDQPVPVFNPELVA